MSRSVPLIVVFQACASVVAFRWKTSGWVDLAVVNLEPFQIAERDSTPLYPGGVVMAVVGGRMDPAG